MNTGDIYLAITFWAWPFGGGEEYIHQTMEWMAETGAKCFWLVFSNHTNKTFTELAVNVREFYTEMRIPGGLTQDNLTVWLKLLRPTLVHHQGHHHDIVYSATHALGIEYVTGIHFWNNFLILDAETRNSKILQNSVRHKIAPFLEHAHTHQDVTIYAASDFVKTCIQQIAGIEIPFVAYAGSLESRCRCIAIDPIYVTVINIHKLKGGKLVLKLIQELQDVPFMVIETEAHSGDLDSRILQAVKNRPGCLYYSRFDDAREIYGQTKILLAPSIVDETFCRTAHEAMMNGIPVLTSGYGNLGYLIDNPDYVISPDNAAQWMATIRDIYFNADDYQKASKYVSSRYQIYSEQVCRDRFCQVISHALSKSKTKNIMIYCPWCDQGLGIQAKNYYQILKARGYRVAVFSFKPYIANCAKELQRDPMEWEITDVYYSANDREQVSDTELIEFVEKYNIGKCIIPETCWYRIFQIAQLMRNLHVKTYCIPNIEIVRRDEIHKHRLFDKILCNNMLCYNTFASYGLQSLEYIGYAISSPAPLSKPDVINAKRFLFIGGMNAFSRKQILQVCQGFVQAYEKHAELRLTCTIQKTNALEQMDVPRLQKYRGHPGITILEQHLSFQQINELYAQHDVSIQVSKHEGLGLGFYDALYTHTPVLTLDTPPHNEIIKPNINGFYVACHHQPMTDNPQGLVESAFFHPDDLADALIDIYLNHDLRVLRAKLVDDIENRLGLDSFIDRFVSAI